MASSDIFGLEAFELLLVAKLVGLVLKRAEFSTSYAADGSMNMTVNLASYHCQG